MKRFLYFVAAANESENSPRFREDCGIAYAFDGEPVATPITHPEYGQGVLLATKTDQPPRIFPNQTWLQLIGSDRVWVGYDELPGPDDLARRIQIEGLSLDLKGDGAPWLLPYVRQPNASGDPECMLPSTLKVDANGELYRHRPTRGRELWEATEWAWEAMVAEREVTNNQCLALAVQLIAANYCVGVTEVSELELFSDDYSPTNLVAQCIGYFEWLKWLAAKAEAALADEDAQKKTAGLSVIRPETVGATASAG